MSSDYTRKLEEINQEIKEVELELVQAHDRFNRAMMELEYKTADIIANTPWRQHGITNQHGRDSFVVLHTMEDREEKVLAEREIYSLRVKRDVLKRSFEIYLNLIKD